MKKILALILAVMMLGTACCALAEETQGAQWTRPGKPPGRKETSSRAA